MSWTFDTNAMIAQLTPEEGLIPNPVVSDWPRGFRDAVAV